MNAMTMLRSSVNQTKLEFHPRPIDELSAVRQSLDMTTDRDSSNMALKIRKIKEEYESLWYFG